MAQYLPTFLRRNKPILPFKSQVSFIEKFGTLLKEGYSISASISMLIPHHIKESVGVEEAIHQQLKEGKDICDILKYLGIQQQYIMSLYVAQQSGALVNGLFMVAKMLQKSTENKQQIVKLASYPLFLFGFLIVLFVCFRSYFLPNMESMFLTRGGDNFIQLTISSILLHLPDFLLSILFLFILVVLFFMHYAKQKKAGQRLLLYYKIPILNRLLQLQLTKQLANELGALLEGGFSLQIALDLLEQQQHQPLVAYNARLFLQEIAQGESLSSAILLNPYVHPAFYPFVVHGEQSGNLGKELQILGEFMEDRMSNRAQRALQVMQPVLFCIIAICILGAYISIMLPMYDMINYV